MIQANEVRRNNLIYYGNMIYPVERITEQSISVRLSSQSLRTAKPHEFEPVTLTPELLEACGFGYLEVEGISQLSDDFDNSPEGNTYNWSRRIQHSAHCDSFTFELVKWGEQEYFTFAYQWLRVRIKYLHQLQNLYFALTGSELSINLEKVKV